MAEQEKAGSIRCTKCNAPLDIDPNTAVTTCPFCESSYSTQELLNESDAVKVQRLQNQADDKRAAEAREAARAQEKKERLAAFKKGKLSKVIVIGAVVVLLFTIEAFKHAAILSGIIGIFQLVLLVGAWLMGMQIIKEPVKNLHLGLAALAVVLAIPMLYGQPLNRHYSNTSVSQELKLGDYEWPNNEAAKQVPKPKSDVGVIEWENENGFCATIGKTSQDDYREYVSACEEMGFTVDYRKSDTMFTADNEAGFGLVCGYEGNNRMRIKVEKHVESVEEEPAEEESDDSSSADSGAVSPDFKKTMDDYEAFIDSYIAFMERYANASDSDTLSMMSDYYDYMDQYTELSAEIDAIDENSLSPADEAYYLEVTGRCSQKLINASL